MTADIGSAGPGLRTAVGYNEDRVRRGHFPGVLAMPGFAGTAAWWLSSVTNLVFRFATVQGQNIHWFLRRNCSVTPQQLGWLYLSLCLVSLSIGTAFWFQGAKLVLPFAWAEVIAVGVAFAVYARHATDGETIRLAGSQLVVELESGGRTERAEFRREWVRVEPGAGDSSLIELSAHGKKVQVGRYVRPELRPQLARELRLALRETF